MGCVNFFKTQTGKAKDFTYNSFFKGVNIFGWGEFSLSVNQVVSLKQGDLTFHFSGYAHLCLVK